ncbi:MAG TPA: sugar ABC transporter permease [Firmicutes bacterium]|nr:sugar ABC transporter permease [Bacillota bacterium]
MSRFVGLANYVKILTDPEYFQVVGRTFIWTFGSLLGQIVLGIAIAMLLNAPMKGRAIFRGLFLLLWHVPTVVSAFTVRWMLADLFGVANWLLQAAGLIGAPILWFGEPGIAMFSTIATNIWRGLPFITVSLLAGLQGIPGEIYEAAKIDGASDGHSISLTWSTS